MSQALIHKELNLNFGDSNDQQILNELQNFAETKIKWKYLENKSIELTSESGVNSLIFSFDDGHMYPWIFIQKRCNGIYEINNVILRKSSEITILEYNKIIDIFAKNYRCFLRNQNSVTKIYKSQGVVKLNLKSIISAPEVRKLFKRYLSTHLSRISQNPNDIQRLDDFIIALFRYSKNKVNTGLLKMYLIKEEGWKIEEAEWCCNRIEIGTSILLHNKNFY